MQVEPRLPNEEIDQLRVGLAEARRLNRQLREALIDLVERAESEGHKSWQLDRACDIIEWTKP